MKLPRDDAGLTFEVFMPTAGKTLSGAYKPVDFELVRLGVAATITIDGVSAAYDAKDELVLSPNVTYTFGASTAVHVM